MKNKTLCLGWINKNWWALPLPYWWWMFDPRQCWSPTARSWPSGTPPSPPATHSHPCKHLYGREHSQVNQRARSSPVGILNIARQWAGPTRKTVRSSCYMWVMWRAVMNWIPSGNPQYLYRWIPSTHTVMMFLPGRECRNGSITLLCNGLSVNWTKSDLHSPSEGTIKYLAIHQNISERGSV